MADAAANITDTAKSHNQHDAFFKESFAILEYAAAFLRERLPRRITRRFKKDVLPELIDSNFVDADGRQSRGDMLYRVWLASGRCIYVLIEHKSHPDAKVLEQLDRYLHGIWKRYAETDANEKQTLPTVIPLVLYHGKQPWSVPKSYAEILSANEIVDKPYGLNFHYRLVDLTKIAHRKLSKNRELRAVLAVLRGYGRRAEGKKNLVDILRTLPHNNQELKNSAFRYLIQVWKLDHNTIDTAARKANPETGGKDMRTFIDDLEDKANAKLIRRQMNQKFGSLSQDVEKQIEQASSEEIGQWADKILTARSLEDMFPGSARH
ncbi:MAG: Rpn family recombination-promoting nuclease/putative transposase [Pseudohongiellaceae bacterium]